MHPDRLEILLSEIRTKRILVIGDAMLDAYLSGTAVRVSPEAPVPVVRVSNERFSLGGAANVAANIAALGAACDLIGCTGIDSYADALHEQARRLGIGLDGMRAVPDRPTTVKTRIMVQHHQVARCDREDDHPLSNDDAAALAAAIERIAPDCHAIVLEDYDKGVLVRAIINAAFDVGRRHGRPVVVDPKARNFFDYAGASWFKPNAAELEVALRAPILPDDADWMERTRRHLDCGHLLVTLGDNGMALATEAGAHARIAATARSVYDVSGAGDTVTAVLALAIAAGASPFEAVILANHAAGIEVEKAGVATISPDELREAVGGRAQPEASGRAVSSESAAPGITTRTST